MPTLRRKMRKLLAAAKKRAKKVTKITAQEFVFAVLLAGLTYIPASSLLLNLGILPIARTVFYEAQQKLLPKIIEFAIQSCSEARKRIKNGTALALDGSWNHRRHGTEHIVELIDMSTGLIVDFEIVSKKSRFKDGNYEGSSNGMELFGFKKMLTRWVNDSRITSIIHDKDSKISKAIRLSGWAVEQIIDANHAIKTFTRFFNGLNGIEKQLLHGLKARLMSWLQHLIHSKIPKDMMKSMWENSINHYTGNHSLCSDPNHVGYNWTHKGNNTAIAVLKKVINKGLEVINLTNHSIGSTQLNECFHSIKAHFANKMLNLATSTPARFALSVIAYNDDDGWREKLRKFLGFSDLPEECSIRLSNIENINNKRKKMKATPEYKANELKRRNDNRNNLAHETKGKNDYKSQ
jgi:hypothetical protein